jgi:hypothetical protein
MVDKKLGVGFFGIKIYFHPKTTNKHHKNLLKSHVNPKYISVYAM